MRPYYIYIFFSMTLYYANAQPDRSKMPEPGPAPEVRIPEAQMFKMSNGMTVILLENHKVPEVVVRMTLDNPPEFFGDKLGIMRLLGPMMSNGTKTIPRDAFREEVDFMGATLSIGPGGIYANTLPEYFPRVMQLLSNAYLHPNFTQEDLDREKEKTIANLKASENNPIDIGFRAITRLTYGKDHPAGEYLTVQDVERVTIEDLDTFHKRCISPGTAYFCVIGDTTLEEVRSLVEKYFGAWRNTSPPSTPIKIPENVSRTEINFIDVPGAVQSRIHVVKLIDLQMKDPDYLPVLIASEILGGGTSGRLFKNLREDKGYTYGASAQLSTDKWGKGMVSTDLSVRNAVTDSALLEVLGEYHRLATQSITQGELDKVKARHTGNFIRSLEQKMIVSGYALKRLTDDLPDDFYTSYLQRIERLTVADVERAARTYFSPENLRLIVIGKGSDVLDNLERVSFMGQPVPLKLFDYYANPIR